MKLISPLYSIIAKFYQILLSLQMMLLISYDWSSRRFKETIEFRMHWFILIFSVAFASVPLFYQNYNPDCGFCRDGTLPRTCDNTAECVRGNVLVATVYNLFFGVIIISATIFCTGAMVVIYRTVYKQEKRMATYSASGIDVDHHKRSKQIRKSMILYTSSFYICWIIPVIGNLLNSHPFRVIGYIFSPLMGFLNALVFLMPKCIKYQNDHPGTWLLTAYICVVFRSPVRLSLRLSEFIAIKRRDSTQSASTSTNPRQSLQPVDTEG